MLKHPDNAQVYHWTFTKHEIKRLADEQAEAGGAIARLNNWVKALLAGKNPVTDCL